MKPIQRQDREQYQMPSTRTVSLSGSAITPGRITSLHLTVIQGPDRGLSQVVDQPRVLVGRGETAHLQLSDPTVSHCHAELRWTPQGLEISDLDSCNGVRIGQVRLLRGLVPPASPITLGDTVIVATPGSEHEVPCKQDDCFGELAGASQVMRELYVLLERLARTDLSLLIQGATGTGKELAARAIHQASRRAGGPFVVLDCTAIPPSLGPSTLFGAEKGAYTGATERRIGVFEAAHGGVLFIDEIGDLPEEMQPMLLRVLQSREVVPVGGTRPRPVNVRVICATWRDLRVLVNQGKLREDLYYRLAHATVWMPALEERREDIPLLVRRVLERLPPEDAPARAISDDALSHLCGRSYPGNVRELISSVERMAYLCTGPVITGPDAIFERMLSAHRRHERPSASSPEAAVGPFKDIKRKVVEEFERTYLDRLLESSGRNLHRAALLAGLERHNLRDLLKKHRLWGE